MEKYTEIVDSMKRCSSAGCEECPYRRSVLPGKSCRQRLLHDAMEALAAEETRADEIQEENEALREALKQEKMQVLLIKESRDELQEERDELREELKNRPEVGFDADTFDKTLEAVLQANGVAKYWHGYADALKWCLHDRFEAVEEGGDDV